MLFLVKFLFFVAIGLLVNWLIIFIVNCVFLQVWPAAALGVQVAMWFRGIMLSARMAWKYAQED
jgi:hypothetical protein